MVTDGHAVILACRVLAVSESGFHTQRHRPPSARAIRHAALTERIGRIHLDSRGTYGARRVHAELTLGHGLSVGRCAVEHATREGKVYRAVVLDAWSRRVVGWSIDSSATTALVTNALGMAIEGRRPDGRGGHESSWRTPSSSTSRSSTTASAGTQSL